MTAPVNDVSMAVKTVATQTALAFTALLPLVNPIGSALIILGLVGNAPPEVYKRLARRIARDMVIFLIVIELTGAAILRFFGVSLPVVQLAGGLVLAGIGWNILNQVQAGPATDKQLAANAAPSYKWEDGGAFYPYTFPITAGPGCLVVMLTLSAHAEQGRILKDLFAHGGNWIASIALGVCVYFCYAYAPRLTAKISQQTAQGFLRIMGFIVLSIGAQIAWNGMKDLLMTVVHVK